MLVTDYSIPILVFGFFFLIWLAYDGYVRKGVQTKAVGVAFGRLWKNENPLLYYATIVGYIVMAFFCLVLAIVLYLGINPLKFIFP